MFDDKSYESISLFAPLKYNKYTIGTGAIRIANSMLKNICKIATSITNDLKKREENSTRLMYKYGDRVKIQLTMNIKDS